MSDNNNDQPSVLTEKEKKQQMISRITAAVIAAVQAANLTDSHSDSSALMSAAASSSVFKIKEIEHFHSDFDKSYDEEDVVFSEKNTLIQDVHLFCNWIQNVTELQEDDIIKINLSVCLQEIVLQWYMHKLSSSMKLDLRHNHDVKLWCDKLIKQFKMNFSAALDKLYAVKYIIDDACIEWPRRPGYPVPVPPSRPVGPGQDQIFMGWDGTGMGPGWDGTKLSFCGMGWDHSFMGWDGTGRNQDGIEIPSRPTVPPSLLQRVLPKSVTNAAIYNIYTHIRSILLIDISLESTHWEL